MRAQRWIVIVALVLGVGYLWLRGGFIGVGASRPAPQPAASTEVASPPVAADSAPATATAETPGTAPAPKETQTTAAAAKQTPSRETAARETAVATFAAGCFWCTEADFDKVPGVISTTSGYTGGRVPNPTYRQVSSGGTGHAESVEIMYDPKVVSYEQLLDHYWRNVDPFSAHGQFCDFGSQYRPVIFVHDAAQRAAAEASKARVQKMFKDMVVVEIVAAGPFYRAEEYHQDYHTKNDAQYRFYRFGCGRDRRLAQIWGNKET
jgi:peptide-methionine (S)-S-oxide reductase